MLNELRQRQQLQQRAVPDLEAQYANLVTPPPPPRDQKPQAMVAAVMGPPQQQQQQQPKPGFLGSPPGGSGPTLADQLKNRLEERRRSQEEVMVSSPADPLHAEMKQAVKAANEAGRTSGFSGTNRIWFGFGRASLASSPQLMCAAPARPPHPPCVFHLQSARSLLP